MPNILEFTFAVKHHDRERPLATHGLEVMQTIATEHQAAFFILAQATASADADNLAESGQIIRCLGVRRKFRLLNRRTLLEDARSYLRYVQRRVTGR